VIVCSDCVQPVGLHKDTSRYYHLPPMKDHCNTSYIMALDLGKAPRRTVQIVKDYTEENSILQSRIERALLILDVDEKVSTKLVKEAVVILKGEDEYDS